MDRVPMRWLDHVPLFVVVFGAIGLGLAPFQPEPHLWEKLRMLLTGTLVKPIDIFDFFMHAAFPVVLVLKLYREVQLKRKAPDRG